MNDYEERVLRKFDAAWLGPDGRLRELPAEAFDVDPKERFLWCAKRARYGLPTAELLAFLRDTIDGRPALEIGAGQGDLGRLLGIPMTDSGEQTSLDMRAYYALLGHAVTEPPPDVERLRALEAIEKHKPAVVIASWVTQLYLAGDEGPPRIGSSLLGVDELELLQRVPCYVHIGNEGSHRQKRALSLHHREIRAPWIVSRSLKPADNFIAIWGSHG
jgi:hypothetical protein